MNTYDIYFESADSSNNKGFKLTFEAAKQWISNNRTADTFFKDYKGGIVQIVCNETSEAIYSEDI